MTTELNDDAFAKKGYRISTDNHLLNTTEIYRFLKEETYWSGTLTEEKLHLAINNSLCFCIYYEGATAGFARVVTDRANFAYLCDVFVMPPHRRLGLSKWLLQTIMRHPDLQGLRRWMLATRDAHGLYRQFGFTELTHPDHWMQIYRPLPAD